jgi:glycerol-3-phosphate acyltransferase PlsY
MPLHITYILVSYLIGSLSAAIIVCKALGLGDPRESGSNNPGATNVLRLHGKKAGILSLAGDLLKGIVPVVTVRYTGSPDWVVAMCGLATFMGHLFPVFFQFKGGKGVATILGVLLATSLFLGLSFIATWLIVAGISRYSSLGGITAALFSPIYALWLTTAIIYPIVFLIMAICLISRHKQNIKRLLAGTESKIGQNRT